VDYAQWDPSTDGHLAAHYTANVLTGKAECRADLLHGFGLESVSPTTPVLGIVSRFATQKGFDILAGIADELMRRNVAVVALGTGEPIYENFFREWAARNPGRVGVQIKYDDALAHKVEAGSDIFLMPSRYEPSGLNQMYSLRYGAVPVVRATGGLDDTIEEWNPGSNPAQGTGTGFKFYGYAPQDFLAAIDRALTAFPQKESWQRLMRNGMVKNYSWTHPVRLYAEVYAEVAKRRG
jgi:starch synthase